jgi:hypothetical protein
MPIRRVDPHTRLESCSKVRFLSSRDDRLRTRASGPLVPKASPNTSVKLMLWVQRLNLQTTPSLLPPLLCAHDHLNLSRMT